MNLVKRSQILELEQSILGSGMAVELPEPIHHFAAGTYTRELHIPAGTVLTGKIHKESCINIITKGKICVATEEGNRTIEAPFTFVSGAGIKKAGYVLEDTIWINVHPWNNEDSLDEIEAKVVIPSFDLLEEGDKLCRG